MNNARRDLLQLGCRLAKICRNMLCCYGKSDLLNPVAVKLRKRGRPLCCQLRLRCSSVSLVPRYHDTGARSSGISISSSSWSSIVGRMKYVMAVRAYNAIHRPQTTLLPVLTSCTRGDTICPRPSPPPVGAQAPRAPPSRRT